MITARCRDATFLTSRTNPLVASLSRLSMSKYRREQRLFLAEGVKLSREAAHLPEVRYVILSSDDGYADTALLDIAETCPDPRAVIVLPASTFAKISTENAPQGIITVLSAMDSWHRPWSPETAAETTGERILAVDSVQDPGNLGTMIRTAAAFGYSRVLLGGCADIYHPRTVRASMGTLFRMRIDLCASLADALGTLRLGGRRVLAAALTEHAWPLGQMELKSDDCIVIGNEGHGVGEDVLASSDGVVRIPMEESAESLNAAGAAAVLMWEYYRAFH